MSFLTITLPTFAKDLERALSQGFVTHDLFLSFKKGPGGLPRFFGGFLGSVFDEHGVLLDTTTQTVDAIDAIRQLSYLFAKIELECTDARKLAAVTAYVVADDETGDWDDIANQTMSGAFKLSELSRMSSLLFGDVLNSLNRKIEEGELTPKHGPGAVAERVRGNAKYDFTTWPARIEPIFPHQEYGFPGLGYHYPTDHVQLLPRDQVSPSRMILVPKSMKTPRVIAAEPMVLQYLQQSIMSSLVSDLEHDPLVGPMIGFTDQLPNQNMAKVGSSDGSLATLDLSEASDRVSLLQALALTKSFPLVTETFEAVRSEFVTLPSIDGRPKRVRPIRKFAPMGSALCFPVEAMAFLAVVFLGIERATAAQRRRSRLSRNDVKSFHGAVRVYGDDIIIPVDCVDEVLASMADYGYRVNANKSFWTGMFRESCGGDFYAGEWVTPIRLKRMIPRDLSSAEDVASLVSFRNRAYMRGYWRTARYLDRVIVGVIRHFPVIREGSSLLGRVSLLPSILMGEKVDRNLHKPLSRGYVMDAKIPRSDASEVGALLKCLLNPLQEDPEHLSRAGRPVAVDIKLRWRPVY
jgi:hypothetical protein